MEGRKSYRLQTCKKNNLWTHYWWNESTEAGFMLNKRKWTESLLSKYTLKITITAKLVFEVIHYLNYSSLLINLFIIIFEQSQFLWEVHTFGWNRFTPDCQQVTEL